MKKALLLNASHHDLGIIFGLRKLGYYILVTGYTPGLIGEKYADKYIKADYSNKELLLEIAKREKINAVLACCSDAGVYTAAFVAEKMLLPEYDSYETTLTLHNKDRFKAFAEKYGIRIPKTISFDSVNDAKKYIEQLSYPVIVKPVDCSGGNGISRADNHEQAVKSINYAFEKTRMGRIVIEQYISGAQHGFCTFLKNKKVVAVCTNNEYSFINQYRVEIDTFPADNYMQAENELVPQIEKIAEILNLKDGIFHIQYILKDGKPYIIEAMRRTIGNLYGLLANMLTGFNWDYWETRARCGLSCDRFPMNSYQEGYYAYKVLLSKRNGIFKSLDIPRGYEKYMIDSYILKKPGYNITGYDTEQIGILLFSFPSNEEMTRVLIDEYTDEIVRIKEVGKNE